MTSHRRRDNDHPMFTTKTPHFFKIILDQTIRDGKLAIPRHFVRKYGKRLPSPVHLEVPSAEVWQVELTKCEGKVWLKKGWQEFAEHYSLKCGHFVVFRYKGNAHFHVVICDRSASEIEYPCTGTEEDDSLVCKKRKEKSYAPCLQPHKKMKVDSPNETGINLESKFLAPTTKGKGIMGQKSQQIEVTKRVPSLSRYEKTKALHKARGFRTKNPFFIVVMQPSFISSSYSMAIPVSFARKYFKIPCGRNGGRNVILCIANGQTWTARYYCKYNGDRPQLRGAWKAFAQHYALHVGDVCVLSLPKRTRRSC